MKGILVHKAKKVIHKHGSTILTVIGAGGVIATTVMAVKATPKALQLIEEAEEVKGEELTPVEKVQVAWKPYIPAVTTGVATIACIFGANALNKKQQASLMSAYALVSERYREYKNQVVERYGEDADKEIEEAINDWYEHKGPLDNGEKLYFDEFSGRYFELDPERVKQAEYELNKLFNIVGEVTVNDWYELLGEDKMKGGDDIGWSKMCYNWSFFSYDWIVFEFTTTVNDDGLETIIITMPYRPDDAFRCY